MPPKSQSAKAGMSTKAGTSRKALAPVPSSKKRDESVECGICGSAIHDGVDESIHCEGQCNRWMHRYCAGIPKRLFEELSASTNPFSCLYCTDSSNRYLIQNLTGEVAALKTEVAVLKISLQSSSSASAVGGSAPRLFQGKTYATVAATNVTASTTEVGEPVQHPFTNTKSSERKFNIVLYGIDECPTGTTWPNLMESDLSNRGLSKQSP